MFSSLNSVRRNCLKQPRPAELFITFSNDSVQERASSSVGRRLGGGNVTIQTYFILSAHVGLRRRPAEVFHYLSSQFMGPSVRRSQVDLWTASSSLLTVRLRGNMYLLHQNFLLLYLKNNRATISTRLALLTGLAEMSPTETQAVCVCVCVSLDGRVTCHRCVPAYRFHHQPTP